VIAVRRQGLAALLVVAALASACDSKAPKVATSEAPAPAGNPREEAAALVARGDYAGAERRYREALTAKPDDVELHYGLGSALSQLDRRDDAAAEFRWVVANGRPGRPEVDSARKWLAEAGAAGATAPVASSTQAADPSALGTVAGKLTWPDIPAEKQFAIRIFVVRADDDSFRKTTTTKLNSTFSIGDLPEGSYKLIGLAGPLRIWSDLPLTIAAGRQTTFDLSPANAVVSATEFPVRIR
jgi:tetratricopeptide (TPR) repeat protein